MSSAVSPSQVTSSTPILVTPSSDTKSFNEHKRDDSIDRQQLNKQNKTYTRGNSNKNKQLTRSHAMKESTSPPRTPNSHSPNDMKSHSPTAPAMMTAGDDNSTSSSSSQHLTAPMFILPQSETNSAGGKSQLDIEFPKLTPPKTKVGWNSSQSQTTQAVGSSQRNNSNRKSVSSDTSSTNNSLCEDVNESHINDKQQLQQQQNQQQKTGSQTISVSTTSTQISSTSLPLCDKKQQQQYSSSNDNNNESERNSNESFNNNNNNNTINNNNNFNNNINNSGNSSNSNNVNHDERVIISPSRTAQCKSPNYNDTNNNSNGSSKSTPPVYPLNIKGKPPLKNMGSSSSCEGGNTSSGFISRDSSSEQFVDQNGIDLVQFFKETLNKNAKDRNMLMKIERDLSQLAVDQTGRTFIKFPPMSSYNRMLVHRTAAYFGMDHNVDSTQQCVIASTTKDTRIPDIRFKTLIRDTFSEEPRKSILKREAHSFEDYRQGGLLSVQRSILNRKAKSFEERDEEYEKEWPWIHHDGGGEMSNKLKVPIRFMKIHASKSHSFGGYGGSNATLMRDDSITSSKSAGPRLHKQDSATSTTWRLSPSSSGYKTQSLRSDSSPTGGYGSDTPEPSTAQSPDATRGVVWAVTDLASVPKGSLIIDPQTLQPILNQDGSLYHFDPSNPPSTSSGRYPNAGNSRKKPERQKSLNNNNINNNNNNMNSNAKPNSNTNTNNSNNNGREHINNNNTNTHNTATNNSMMMVINNIGNTENSEKSAILINNKHSSLSHSNVNHLSTNNICNNNDDESYNEDDNEDDTMNYDHVDVMPLDAISPKIHDDGCITKDENCENKSSQCEMKSQSSHLSAEELMSPKLKNQSTSPNLPLSDATINEEEESVTPTSSVQPIIEEDINVDVKKDELTSVTETPPVQEIRFQTNPYSNSTASATPTLPPVLGYAPATPFTTAPIETAGTIYHTGPDGTLYVLSQPVMYSYTTTSTENEVPSCWVPIFDQGAIPSRDPNLTVLPVATPYNGPTLYQSPVVYSTEQFTNPPAIAGQYPVGAYPMGYATYPVNGAPYQNIWPQPMTYFLPPSATPGPTQVLVPPAAPQTPNATLIQSTASNTHTPSTNPTGRRNSPPTNHNNATHTTTTVHGSTTVGQTSTAVPIQTFPPSVPFSIAATSETTSASGPAALYAIPPSVYPNVLPYPAPATGFYQPLPHPQTNTTIISSVIPHSASTHPSGTVPSTPHSFQTTSTGEVITHFPFNQQPPMQTNGNNATSTPQSAPSTPLSLTTVPPNFKNPPLFTTQPLIAAAPVHIATAHYDTERKTNSVTMSSAPKKYHNSNNNGGNGILSTPPAAFQPHSNATKPSNIGGGNRQPPLGSYQASVNAQGGKKGINNNNNNNNNSSNSHSEDTNSLSNSNMSSNYSSSNRIKNSSSNRDQTSSISGSYQPKSSYNSNKSQQQQHHQQSYSSNSNSPNSNDNSESTNISGNGSNNNNNNNTNNNNNGSKYPPRGPGSRIPPLDLKRNNSSANVVPNHHTRSTPSTNSTESNNSPNSITSYDHSRSYHYTSQHHQQHHNPQQHHHHHQQPQYVTSGNNSGTHYYRGSSAGAINTNIHHNTNNNSHNSTESPSIQTCFPFNVHSQNPGTSTPLLDSCHPQPLIGYNNPMAAGMYVKFGQAFTFANPLPNNRKSPSNDIRAPLAPLAGVYSTMMLPGGPRQIHPRTMQNNHNYKGNRTQQR